MKGILSTLPLQVCYKGNLFIENLFIVNTCNRHCGEAKIILYCSPFFFLSPSRVK